MVYEDWDHQANASTNHEITTAFSVEGNGSLRIKSNETNSREILKQSQTDQPTEARVEYEGALGNLQGSLAHVFFRYKDPDNFYVALPSKYLGGGVNDYAVQLVKVENGNTNRVDVYNNGAAELGSGSFDSDVASNTFFPVRVSGWEDAGTFRVRIESDADRDGTWNTWGGGDLVDGSPSFGTGGAVGVGMWKDPDEGFHNDSWIDDTKVYY